MHFYWIRDRTSQGHFLIYWQPSITNLGSNIQRQSDPNTPHTPRQNPPTARKYSTHNTTTLLLYCLQKQSA